MRAHWLVMPLLVLSAMGAGAMWLFTASQRAEASHPDLVEQAVAELLTYQTLYNGWGTGGILQVDVAQEIITYDYEDARIHWDGTTLWMHRKGMPAPMALPVEWEDRVRAVWNEWRGGFANTQFVLESPRTFDDSVTEELADTYYRVNLPFAWASGYRVYASVGPNGILRLMSVYHADTLEPLSVGPRRFKSGAQSKVRTAYFRNAILRPPPSDANVPLSPETYSPNRPSRPPSVGGWRPGAKPGHHGEWADPTWHQLQQFVQFLPTDPTDGWDIVGPQMSQRCETAPMVYKWPMSFSFALPDDPERKALALQAATDCPNAGFHMSLTAFHYAAVGARTCAHGQWRVVNTLPDPEVVLWQHQITECRNGPNDARLAYPTDLPLPTGSDPTGLEVRFQGEVRVECASVGGPGIDAVNVVMAGFKREDWPTLSWPGCYPGWPPP